MTFTGPYVLHWNGCLAEEVWITKHILIVDDETHHCNFWIQDVKLACVIPDWIESVLR